MSLPPQKFREIVFQLLYSQDVTETLPESIPFMMEALKVTRRHVAEAESKMRQIVAQLEKVDAEIEKVSTAYSFDRISKVEKTVIRLGIYEFLHEALPLKVMLAEAMRLCRKFGTPEGVHFVNAILDEICAKSGEKPLPV